ncbi:ThuA domain-containing protein [uncultured Eudoraea sp.]|uniref:ThuA domain-containing protein n=1 Tax=uncultured Eudoraea sp. TaxID=1035614 RepID=UPI00260F5BF0|nr:ThuA domain-containing protein [uncultured Eudoraea sp.]
MKNVLVLLIGCLLITACGQKSKQENSEKPETSPKQWLTFNTEANKAKHIVLISGDEEYRSEEALPQLAKILSAKHGFRCTVLFAQDPSKPGIINSNYVYNIPGLDALDSADLMIIFTRFRALPNEQMQFIDNYLRSGKPVIGIRTATHAFNFDMESDSNFKHYSNGYSGAKKEWVDGFGRMVLGEKWIAHHGHHKHQSTRGVIDVVSKSHPITNGIKDGDIWGPTDVYGVRLPLPGNSQPIILGEVMERIEDFNEEDLFYGMRFTDTIPATRNDNGVLLNDPMMPIAWTKNYQIPGGIEGKAFTTTIGAATDMLNEGVRRLLVNSVFWSLEMEVPKKADVGIVGDFEPTAYEFRDDAYWLEKQLKVEDFY